MRICGNRMKRCLSLIKWEVRGSTGKINPKLMEMVSLNCLPPPSNKPISNMYPSSNPFNYYPSQ